MKGKNPQHFQKPEMPEISENSRIWHAEEFQKLSKLECIYRVLQISDFFGGFLVGFWGVFGAFLGRFWWVFGALTWHVLIFEVEP